MTTMRLRPLLFVAALALLGSSGIARAGGGDTSHKYCPRGASMYRWIFGYWCEDGTYAGVHPLACKSGPGQAPGTWNNSALTPDQLCMQQSSAATQPVSTNP